MGGVGEAYLTAAGSRAGNCEQVVGEGALAGRCGSVDAEDELAPREDALRQVPMLQPLLQPIVILCTEASSERGNIVATEEAMKYPGPWVPWR
jgi:hypothetical protein